MISTWVRREASSSIIKGLIRRSLASSAPAPVVVPPSPSPSARTEPSARPKASSSSTFLPHRSQPRQKRHARVKRPQQHAPVAQKRVPVPPGGKQFPAPSFSTKPQQHASVKKPVAVASQKQKNSQPLEPVQRPVVPQKQTNSQWRAPNKKRVAPKKKNDLSANIPTSNFIEINNIPPMSLLEDILTSINAVLDLEYERGIVDLDAEWDPTLNEPLPLVEIDPGSEWVRTARLIVSNRGRPAGWRIEFQNRSIVHAFLQHARETQFLCMWKPVQVSEWTKKKNEKQFPVDVSDCMIRVENSQLGTTVDNVRHLFRRYDTTWEGPSVVECKFRDKQSSVFIVHFADPSWARAAVRELQGIEVRGNFLLLAQYPRQILP